MPEFLIIYRQPNHDYSTARKIIASDLPAAVAGFYAMYGPASNGPLRPIDFISVELVREEPDDAGS